MDQCLTKICRKHGLLSPEDVDKHRHCRICLRECRRARYAANPRRVLDQHKIYAQKHKKRIAERGRAWAIANPDRVAASRKKYAILNKESIKARQTQWYEQNLERVGNQRKGRYSTVSKSREQALNRVYRTVNREYLKELSKEYRKKNKEHLAASKKARSDALRLKALNHYSDGQNCCALCKIKELLMLCFDHINGDGAQHRRKTKGHLVEWFHKYHYPDGFRVLCWNCNTLEHLHLNPPKECARPRYQNKLKQTVMDHYSEGPANCKICGTSDLRILTIDHMNGGGKQHRISINAKGGGAQFYRWLRDQGYPSGYQVLCFNHNCTKDR